ncbi:DNA damage-regulated autophagy modulator protein 1 isoform X10 [Erinaceus europaeus]|uniref:DNA damage-regulated autophagy modulator protein 1 isoform X10 n=1 Tax=Erinaceus europaeus TaxID=9365 RepID=A0ABM3XN47_ERIEU|nr:DNA damage-regulated autophagy modulator protein 1 isoform X10 [Erinaceus europaeus]
MLCFLKGMAFVPFLLVTWSSAAFIISYVVAVLSGHVNPFLPYISDTGTTPPESGIFGFMINFSAFLGAATMYTRYKIVEKQNQTSYFSTPVFNLVSLVLGLVGCIGMGIVANFQELAVPVVHDGGALLAFVCGVVYTLLQSVISYKSCPQWNSLFTCHIRMAISAVSCAAVVPTTVLLEKCCKMLKRVDSAFSLTALGLVRVTLKWKPGNSQVPLAKISQEAEG